MLVKVGYTKNEAIGPVFDEETSRKTRGMRYDEWAEFIVYWRNSVIHFYEPHVDHSPRDAKLLINELTEFTRN